MLVRTTDRDNYHTTGGN